MLMAFVSLLNAVFCTEATKSETAATKSAIPTAPALHRRRPVRRALATEKAIGV